MLKFNGLFENNIHCSSIQSSKIKNIIEPVAKQHPARMRKQISVNVNLTASKTEASHQYLVYCINSTTVILDHNWCSFTPTAGDWNEKAPCEPQLCIRWRNACRPHTLITAMMSVYFIQHPVKTIACITFYLLPSLPNMHYE